MTIPLRLLIVDDSQDDVDLVLHALKTGGYEVNAERVDTAETMRSTLLREPWNLIISDYSMPKFTGLDALSLFQEAKLDIPFILVSGTVGEDVAVSAMKAGAADYIMKDNLLRLVPAVQRELSEAANRVKLKEKDELLKQAQKMELIGRLASGVAHDFNNVLAVILMYCEMLLYEVPLESPMRRSIEQINRSGERGVALTRQLLAFSRKQVLAPLVLDLNAVVRNMKNMLYTLIGEHIQLATQLEPSLGSVRVDPGQMEQVIMNLIVNARDAMPTGGSIAVKTGNIEIGENSLRGPDVPPGKYTFIEVADNGHGMDAETKSRIFEPFFTTKSPDKGTGLGLSTVFGIVKQSNGYISVESQLGKGTTFKIYLPQLDLPAQPLSIQPKKQVEPEKGSGTILLVEDAEALREAIGKCLELIGYTVLKPQTHAELVATLDQQGKNIDLLLTDIVMPDINGPELATRLRNIQPKVKILFISGFIDDTLEAFDLARNRASFLQKPFSSNELRQKIQSVMKG